MKYVQIFIDSYFRYIRFLSATESNIFATITGKNVRLSCQILWSILKKTFGDETKKLPFFIHQFNHIFHKMSIKKSLLNTYYVEMSAVTFIFRLFK